MSRQNSLVDAIVEAVSKRAEGDTLEQLRQMVRLESELAESRKENDRKDAEIVALRSHINSLGGFLSTLAPTAMFPMAPSHLHQLPQPPTGYSQFAPAPPAYVQVPAPAPNHSSEAA